MAGTDDWVFPSLVHYYDANTDVVTASARRLAVLDEASRNEALATVAAAVNEHVGRLAAEGYDLSRVAVSVVDDLYKTLANAQTWSAEASAYLRASFGAFLAALSDRGMQVRYVVENTFPEYLDRPLSFYPAMFRQAGFVYVCPHELAWRIAQHDGRVGQDEIPTLADLAGVIDEARAVAEAAATQAVQERRHLAYFEIDWQPGCLDAIQKLASPPVTVHVFRSAAPEPGTTVEFRVTDR